MKRSPVTAALIVMAITGFLSVFNDHAQAAMEKATFAVT